MPCCLCEQDRLTFRDYMNATAWYVCDACMEKHHIIQVVMPEDSPATVEPEPITGPEADDFSISPV